MNRKVKNTLHSLQENGQATTATLLQKSAKLLKQVNFKNPRTQLITAGAVGLVGAAGLAYYLLNKRNKLA